MEQLCVVIYENSENERKIFHDVLAAYAISRNVEVTIRWLKPSVQEDEIASACVEAQTAFVNAAETERAVLIGRVLCRENPNCALIYYGRLVPQETKELVSYFSSLFPARPIRYLDQPSDRDYYQTVSSIFESVSCQNLFVWETKGIKYRLPYDSILYFRSERNYICVRLKNGVEYSWIGKLANVERMLPDKLFVRVHQSYLVNKAAILLIDKGKKRVRLSSGEDIFISKAHYKETLEI